jgi:hypothetical protein
MRQFAAIPSHPPSPASQMRGTLCIQPGPRCHSLAKRVTLLVESITLTGSPWGCLLWRRYMRRWPACLLSSCFVLLMSGAVAQARLIEFVVAELPGSAGHNDSFIVQIDDADPDQADELNHARSLVNWVQSGAAEESSPGATIVVAHIAPGSDGVNRDVLAPSQPFWSWHVDQPIEFADNTIEVLDGWPTFVEQDVPGWIDNTNSFVGFWTYTIVSELQVPEPATGAWCLLGAGVLLRRRGGLRVTRVD